MEFDFVIVGAGSAGCVLANRLSEGGQYSVAILEAGPKDNYPWIHVPVGYFKTLDNPRTDWRYKTNKDPGLNNRSIGWPRGRTLGGSSSINGLLYVRGQKQDFDHWRQLGNAGWSWEDVLPYFRRAESWEGGSTETRGGDGPLTVSKNRVNRDIVDAWVEAAQQAGYKFNDDYNGEDQEGVGYFQMTMRNGWRCSTAVAYLKPAKSRSNLKIVTDAPAKRLSFNGGRADGVVVNRNGKDVTIKARREVILSAGAIGSPQLLMLSGIGPGAHLQDVGIDVRVNASGVGGNLQDHLQARPIYKCSVDTLNTEINSIFKKGKIGLEYVLKRSGPMAMAASLGTGFLKTRPELETPDIQFHIQPFSADNILAGPHPFKAFTASVLQLRPESTGQIRLRSSDPDEHPDIDPNYLATELDCRTLVDGIKITRNIAKHDPLKSLITEEYSPGVGVAEDDDDAILDWARNTSTTIYHPTGTCKMGVDDNAVVDERLRVRGVEGLRVADASIMPVITSGNTNAPCIMIGEKASDLIKQDALNA